MELDDDLRPQLDEEWHARNSRPLRRKGRSPGMQFILIILIVILNLGVGIAGGVTGFVALSNSDSTWAREIRKIFNLDNSQVVVPVLQQTRLDETSAVIDAAEKVSPSVVAITATSRFTDFFGRTSNQETGGGSGFIITADGLIVTNRHVVENQSGATFKAVLNDGRVFDAQVKAVDSFNDLAILKIDAKDLKPVEIGSSDELKVGQFVLAIGNALGEFKNTVTSGIVSSKGRQLNSVGDGSRTEQLTDLIQTDAAINPGNSGGPLVNTNGQVVGINTAIASTTGGSIGIGFSIAIDSVKNVIESVRQTGEIVRPYLGIRYVPINTAFQQANGLSVDYGVLVARGQSVNEPAVIPGSPADKAGVKENDIILEVNGNRIDENNSLQRRLQTFSVGQEVSLKILRAGAESTLNATLEKAPNISL